MTKKTMILLCALIFLLVFGGCASRQEIIKLKQQADYLEQSNYRMEKTIAQLDSLAKEQLKQTKSLKADINNSFEEMNQRMDILENKVEETKRGSYKTASEKEIAPQDVERKEAKPDTSKLQINLNPEKLYKSAYLDLTKGNYDLAIGGFSDYLKYFPEADLAPNAQYWIGECYYAKEDFERAVVEFLKVIEKYPQSDKIPSTLYKLGLSYSELKETKTAKEYFDKLIKAYPQSQEAKLAKERQKKP
ncbi:MAG: tol-pal system protein YbgF [candidate division Zixibacteria bacterium]|nr:tol-pal system protein YbgF [candidate division Zixibacteria bacterium]